MWPCDYKLVDFSFSLLFQSAASRPALKKKKKRKNTHGGTSRFLKRICAHSDSLNSLSLSVISPSRQTAYDSHLYTTAYKWWLYFLFVFVFFPFVCIAFFLSLYLASITLSYYVLKQMPDGSCRYIRIVYYAILQFSFLLLLFFLVLYVVAYSRHIRIVCYDMGTGAFRSSVGTLTGAYDSLVVVVRFSFL